MSGDYTRYRFEPSDNHSAVWRQQGRVFLDADDNEQRSIEDRRWRSETYDVIGSREPGDPVRCLVPATTRDAFRLTPTAPGELTIGIGRAYIDGIQAENHGQGTESWDEVLAELRAGSEVPWDDQPYLDIDYLSGLADSPYEELAGTTGQRDLFYLDVFAWEREPAIHLELLEEALGDVDTTTRRQTVWQVKAIQDVDGAVDCDVDLSTLDSTLAPSGGRLTTSTDVVAEEDEPCVIELSGGYRGVENRLYRVEIHQGGDLDVARFKWSRTNASVVTLVEEMSAGSDEIKVASLGRDGVLSFQKNDWVEINDEERAVAGLAGFMAQIAEDPLEEDRVLVLDRALPALGFDDADPEGRRTWVRRWDQQDDVDTDGLLTVPASGTVHLEDGVRVEFSIDPSGGQFLEQDAWSFYARTATGDVEELDAAPPRCVHHHRCVIGFINWETTPTFDDCRQIWPPEIEVGEGEGCCTEVVHPGESIQDALSALPAEGGCVCLKAGVHEIEDPLVIFGSDIVLHGESPGTIVRRSGGAQVLVIAFAERIRVERIRFEVPEADSPGTAMAQALFAAGVAIRDCVFDASEAVAPPSAVGLLLVADLLLERDRALATGNGAVGVLVGGRVEVRGCELSAPASEESDGGVFGIGFAWLFDTEEFPLDVTIADDRVAGYSQGVYVANSLPGDDPVAVDSGRVRVDGNWVVRSAPSLHPDWPGEPPCAGIEVHADGALVCYNRVEIAAAGQVGIYVIGDASIVQKNQVLDSTAGGEDLESVGILVGIFPAGDSEVAGVVVLDNLVRGALAGVGAVNTRDLLVARNQVHGRDGFGRGVFVSSSTAAEILANRVRAGGTGIQARECEEVHAAACRVEECADSGFALVDSDGVVADSFVAGGEVGILIEGDERVRLSGNRIGDCSAFGILAQSGDGETGGLTIHGGEVVNCGFRSRSDEEAATGWLAAAVFAMVRELAVRDLLVLDPGRPPKGDVEGARLLGIHALVSNAEVQDTVVRYTELDEETREKLAALDNRALLLERHPGQLEQRERGRVMVEDSRFDGPSATVLVEIGRWQTSDPEGGVGAYRGVTFSGNHCLHVIGIDSPDWATVSLAASHVVVVGNHVRAVDPSGKSAAHPSFDFNDVNQAGTFLGNAAMLDEPIRPGAVVKPAPSVDFNVKLI